MNAPPVIIPGDVLGAVGLTRAYVVERAMHEVALQDGTLHALHHVRLYGLRDRYLRALRFPGHVFAVIDLRRLAPSLGPDIPGYLERDVPGLVKYTLRPLFPTQAALHLVAVATTLAAGVPEPMQ